MFGWIVRSYRKLPEIIRNFVEFLLFLGIVWLIYLVWPNLNALIPFWVNYWPEILQSIGAIATSIAVIITLWDIRKRHKLENARFQFETEPQLIPSKIDGNEVVKEPNWNRPRVHFVNKLDELFNITNAGRGPANKAEVYISQDPFFKDSNTICDKPIEIPPLRNMVIAKTMFYEPQPLNKIDWMKDFYVKLIYFSYYSNKKFMDVYKAKVVTAHAPVQDDNFHEMVNQIQNMNRAEEPKIKQTVTLNMELVSYILNFIPIESTQEITS